ncbi:MAG: secretin N-terminal domain-containing protein, partial [Desulfuromonadales bacterium]|nr:secretin N-terminal domain-containing protein [Desulfuromonadales bacterium]
MTNRTFTWLLIVLILSMTTGCAGKRAFSRGEDALLQHDYAAAVNEFTTAVEEDPGKHEYRISLLTARAEAAQHHLKQARGLTDEEKYAEAAGELERAISYDPGLDVAVYELNKIRKRLEMKNRLDEARAFYRERRLPQAQRVIDEILRVNPDQADALALNDQIRSEGRTLIDGVELEVASDEPITLKFKDADLKDVFNILSQLSGINFIFDGEIRSEKISILLENGTFGQALELLLNMNKLDKKILNSKSIIIYPLSKEKAKQYEDQVIQTFYLSNIDAKKAVNLLRTMLQLRKVYVHEELNALVIRDTPEVIKLAKQLLEAADRQDAEVIFDLELVEISHGDGLQIGPKLQGGYQLQAGIKAPPLSTTIPESGAAVTTSEIVPVVLESLRDLRGIDFLYGLPSASFDLAKTKTDSEILANPQIRVRNKEKAKVHVGTREPVITVTTSGDNVTENIQYVDVGVKLDVEPTVQLDNTVITKITLEVSSV